jgi:hypothetical protein
MTHPDATTGPAAPAEFRQQLGAANQGVLRVFGTEEDLARRIRPTALNRPHQHRVAVLVRPDMRQRSWLAADLLSALGVSHHVTGISRDADSDWLLTHTWLVARDIHDLCILRAEWLPEPLLTDLTLLAAGCGLRLWLLMTPPRSDELARTLDAWAPHELTWAQFTDAFADVPDLLPDPAPDPAHEQLTLPQSEDVPALLPDDDFPSFRAACRDALTPGAFQAVEQLLTVEQTAAARWLDTQPSQAPTPQALADALLARYDQCATTGQLLVTTRSWQVALFVAGWFLQVDLPRLVSTADATPRTAQRTPQLWQLLAVYRQPHRSAACALAALGLDLTAILALTVSDVRPGGDHVRLDGTWTRTEPGTAVYLRAALALRALHGADPSDPLLAHPDGKPVRERALADAISAARSETGLVVTSRLVARKRLLGDRWYTRWGLSIQPLDGPR